MRAIRCAKSDPNADYNRNSDFNNDTNRDPNPNVYAMHGEMYTDTAPAPYAGTAPIA